MSRFFFTILSMFLFMLSCQTYAAVSIDRTRVIYPGEVKSISLTVRNNNKNLPYLAQAWLEDANGKKVNSSFTVLPPVQRLEPGMESLIKVQGMPAISLLPQDEESIFYLNVREIPPRSDKPNILQLALQTRIKFFYRPKKLLVDTTSKQGMWQQQLTLHQQGDKYLLDNPTPYYITIVETAISPKANAVEGFTPVMLAPHSSAQLNLGSSRLGLSPSFIYVDDYGGRHTLSYQCAGAGKCNLQPTNDA